MQKFDLSVLVGILSGVDSDHGTGPIRNGSVNSRLDMKVMLNKDVHLSSHLADYVWSICQFLLEPQKFNSL